MNAAAEPFTFDLVGVPSPQGSKSVTRRGQLIEGSSAHGRAKWKQWRATATVQAHAAWRAAKQRQPIDGPIAVTIRFALPMPASRPAPIRHRGWNPHTVKPDIDKLARSTLDALTAAGVIRDDARVWRLHLEAVETVDAPGATVTIHTTGDDLGDRR